MPPFFLVRDTPCEQTPDSVTTRSRQPRNNLLAGRGSCTAQQTAGDGLALNPNLHLHMLFLDGVYVEDGHRKLRFHRVEAPNLEELKALVNAISHRVAGFT